jgi:hypothetical protein
VIARARCCVAAAALLAAACVTTYEDAPLTEPAAADFAVPVTIPFGDVAADERPLLQLYEGVFERLKIAIHDRDLAEVETLLASFERDGLPAGVRGRLAGYRCVALGMRFQQHAAAQASLRLQGTPDGVVPPLGAPLRFRLDLPPAPEPATLGGRDGDDPIGFHVAVSIADLFLDGSSRTHSAQDFVSLPADFVLADGAPLELPIGLDLPEGDPVRREVHVRVDLMPGYVQTRGARVPVHRTTLAAAAVTQWPAGHEAVQRAPLATLREAMRLGDAAHFRHVFLAATFTEGEDRETAIDLLIGQVRLGRLDQALVAMVALRAVTGAEVPIGDREAWLAWSQSRR